MTHDSDNPSIGEPHSNESSDDVTDAPSFTSPGTAPDLDAVRDLVLRAHPDVIPELITGDTINDLLASVEPAQAAYQQIATSFQQPPHNTPSIPAGGDRPMPVDPARLPAGEKIRRGLSRNHA